MQSRVSTAGGVKIPCIFDVSKKIQEHYTITRCDNDMLRVLSRSAKA